MNIVEHVQAAEAKCAAAFDRIDRMALHNTARVLEVFQKHEVAVRHFSPTTGYGYGDVGRDTLEQIFADLFGTQAAVVRPQIASGTHVHNRVGNCRPAKRGNHHADCRARQQPQRACRDQRYAAAAAKQRAHHADNRANHSAKKLETHDKRDTAAERDAKREIERAFSRRRDNG